MLAADELLEQPYLIIAVPAAVAIAAFTALGYVAKKRANRANSEKKPRP